MDEFCEKLNGIEHIKSSELYRIMISSSANLSRAFKQYSSPSVKKILDRLTSSFMHLNGKEINGVIVKKVEDFE